MNRGPFVRRFGQLLLFFAPPVRFLPPKVANQEDS